MESPDSTRKLDLSTAVRAPAMPKLKPSSETITLRMPTALLSELKMLANQRDVPYQSLMKILLAQAIQHEQNT
ncbi:MAG: hypothetical protein IT446_11050 [Phycisphaerales bacterium]|nr:hypothetical protein [Phycisphaerales bacterium]